MIIHNFDPVFLDFGIIQIRWYSIAYLLAVVFGWIYINKIIINLKEKTTSLSISKKIFEDIIIYLVLGIVVGGRLGYVLFYDPQYYLKNILEIFYIWKGGMSFHGGLIGVVLASAVYGKINKLNFLELTDLVSCAAPIGLFFGRIANFINGELYGKASELPWSVIFPEGGNITRHPSQIYEALLEGVLLFLIINFFAFKRKGIFKIGLISSMFLIYYSILRIIGEFFREPDQHLGYFFNILSMGTILSIVTFGVGMLIFFNTKKNAKSN